MRPKYMMPATRKNEALGIHMCLPEAEIKMDCES